MAILDTNIVNVALPKIMATFGTTVEQVEWVITGYMIAFAIIMPTTNWLRAALGLKKTFILSLAIFCFGRPSAGWPGITTPSFSFGSFKPWEGAP